MGFTFQHLICMSYIRTFFKGACPEALVAVQRKLLGIIYILFKSPKNISAGYLIWPKSLSRFDYLQRSSIGFLNDGSGCWVLNSVSFNCVFLPWQERQSQKDLAKSPTACLSGDECCGNAIKKSKPNYGLALMFNTLKLLFRLGVTLLNFGPVDHIKKCSNVIWTTVLVV